MVLHFSLKEIFWLVLGLMCWQVLWPYPLLGAGLGLGCAWLWHGRRMTVVDAVFAASFLMNVWYVFSSWGNVRQYDYFNFVMQADYFIAHDFFLISPVGYLQSIYFQPPLWALIAALITKLCLFLGTTQAEGFDCVRLISLFCVSGAGILFWRMTGLLSFKGKIRGWMFAFFCFFPFHGILANLVNNDAMTYFLMVALMFVGYRWYLYQEWKDALGISGLLLVVGLVKFSGLMIVPALGVLGICVLGQAKDKLSMRMWGQFVVIGLGAALGFGWGWFLLYYDLPLVPPPLDVDFQDMGRYGLTDRLFSLQQLTIPFVDIKNGIIEPNVVLALLKTGLFGEWAWTGGLWANILYILGIIWSVLAVILFFSLYRYKIGKDYAFNVFAVVLTFSVLAAWIGFWLEYPYFCSCEFRYVVILLPLSLLWVGNYLWQKSLPKAVEYALAGGVLLLVLARFMLYLHTI